VGFVGRDLVEQAREKRRPIVYADATLVVQRGEEWGYEITPFFLRYVYEEEGKTWILYDASMVRDNPKREDATFFAF
jgi:hypothetical protein